MAFGSGSSLATDCWMRRIGFPSSEKLLKVGKATLLHQHSSSKPVAHSGSAAAPSLSRSLAKLAFFSFVQGIGRAYPSLGPLPPHSEKACERRPDRLTRDPPLGESLLEAHLCRHLQCPEATVVGELPRRAVEHLPQSLGAVLVESVSRSFGTRRAGYQSIKASLVEVVDGVAHRLLSAAQVYGYLRDLVSPRTGQQHLGTAQGEGVFGAQPCFQGFALFFGKRTYEDWSFHAYYCNSQPETYSGDALGNSQVTTARQVTCDASQPHASSFRAHFYETLCLIAMNRRSILRPGTPRGCY